MSATWGVVDAAGDYNGDGKSDILWRNSADDTATLWQMNGAQVVSTQSLGTIPAAWKIVDGTEFSSPVSGDSGSNTLLGTTINDTLIGLDGNDSLDGKAGTDILIGGAGSDTYLFGV